MTEVVCAALLRLEEDEAYLMALRSAIEEGDASPDVVGFDEEVFISKLKAGKVRPRKKGAAGQFLRVARNEIGGSPDRSPYREAGAVHRREPIGSHGWG